MHTAWNRRTYHDRICGMDRLRTFGLQINGCIDAQRKRGRLIYEYRWEWHRCVQFTGEGWCRRTRRVRSSNYHYYFTRLTISSRSSHDRFRSWNLYTYFYRNHLKSTSEALIPNWVSRRISEIPMHPKCASLSLWTHSFTCSFRWEARSCNTNAVVSLRKWLSMSFALNKWRRIKEHRVLTNDHFPKQSFSIHFAVVDCSTFRLRSTMFGVQRVSRT